MPADIGDADSQDPPDGGRALPELALAILGIRHEAAVEKSSSLQACARSRKATRLGCEVPVVATHRGPRRPEVPDWLPVRTAWEGFINPDARPHSKPIKPECRDGTPPAVLKLRREFLHQTGGACVWQWEIS